MKEECSSYKNTATGWKLYCVNLSQSLREQIPSNEDVGVTRATSQKSLGSRLIACNEPR